MSLRDYVKTRDKFELGDGQHFGGFDFPCCDCKHVKQSADLEPCRTCDHNVNAVKDTANAAGEVRRNAVTSTGLLADESKGEVK